MNGSSPPAQYLLLSLADRPSRYLDSAGLWVLRGSTASPLLAWPTEHAEAAQAAAERASSARGLRVEVVMRAASDGIEAQQTQWFTEGREAALHGSAPLSEAKARRLRNAVDKLAAFGLVVRASSTAADQASFAEVSRAASKAMRAKFGGGTITTAFAWMAGGAAQEALESVLRGEVALTGPMSVEELTAVVALAREAERLRGGG